MARYKPIDTSPRFIAVDLERQLLPGTFEHALNYLVDHRLDLSRFDARYKNDLTGASAKRGSERPAWLFAQRPATERCEVERHVRAPSPVHRCVQQEWLC